MLATAFFKNFGYLIIEQLTFVELLFPLYWLENKVKLRTFKMRE